MLFFIVSLKNFQKLKLLLVPHPAAFFHHVKINIRLCGSGSNARRVTIKCRRVFLNFKLESKFKILFKKMNECFEIKNIFSTVC